MLRFEANNRFTLRGKNGVHVFGYNSAVIKRIWMKSGALKVHCWGLALADFGRDPRSGESLRGSRNFVLMLFFSIVR